MVSIVPEGPGRLVLSGQEFQDPIHLVETEPWVYREVRGQETLVFHSPANGKPKLAFLASHPGAAYERITFVQSPPFQLAIGGLASLGILLALLGYPVALLELESAAPPRGYRGPSGARGVLGCRGGIHRGHRCIRHLLQDTRQIMFGLPDSLVVVQWFGRTGSVLAVVSRLPPRCSGHADSAAWAAAIGHTLAVLCQFTLALWSAHWGLLG